jgi:hypothetical protein
MQLKAMQEAIEQRCAKYCEQTPRLPSDNHPVTQYFKEPPPVQPFNRDGFVYFVQIPLTELEKEFIKEHYSSYRCNLCRDRINLLASLYGPNGPVVFYGFDSMVTGPAVKFMRDIREFSADRFLANRGDARIFIVDAEFVKQQKRQVGHVEATYFYHVNATVTDVTSDPKAQIFRKHLYTMNSYDMVERLDTLTSDAGRSTLELIKQTVESGKLKHTDYWGPILTYVKALQAAIPVSSATLPIFRPPRTTTVRVLAHFTTRSCRKKRRPERLWLACLLFPAR